MTQRVVRFHYTVSDPSGRPLDSSRNKAPMTVLEGAGQLVQGVEDALRALLPGERKTVMVPAAQAYGAREAGLVHEITRDQLPSAEVAVGDRFATDSATGRLVYTVVAVSATHVTLDANHPLAGLDLTFDLEIVEARPATDDEIHHGHAHGEGGHH